jgi:hypothetical protein
MKWNFFVAACLLMGYLMDVVGLPTPVIAAGVGLSTVWNVTKTFGSKPKA